MKARQFKRRKRNPAGSKMIRRAFKNHHGYKAPFELSLGWYRTVFDKLLEKQP